MKITKNNCWFAIEIIMAAYLILCSCINMKSIVDNNYSSILYKTGYEILNQISIPVVLFTTGITEMKIVTK